MDNSISALSPLQLSGLLNILPDALIAIDKTGAIVLSNNQADLLFGYTHEEMMQMHVDMLLPERFRQAHARHRHGYFQAPQARSMGTGLKLYGLHKDMTEFSIDISLRPVEVDEVITTIAAIRDMSNISLLYDRVEVLTKLIQDKTIVPVLTLSRRVESMEQRMDTYDAKIQDMQIKLTEVSDATKANHIILSDIQENMKTLDAINSGIKSITKTLKRASLWAAGVVAGAASIALATLIINYFTHR